MRINLDCLRKANFYQCFKIFFFLQLFTKYKKLINYTSLNNTRKFKIIYETHSTIFLKLKSTQNFLLQQNKKKNQKFRLQNLKIDFKDHSNIVSFTTPLSFLEEYRTTLWTCCEWCIKVYRKIIYSTKVQTCFLE